MSVVNATNLVATLNLPRPPWEHQKEEWALSVDMPERLLYWEMGTGKTTTATVWTRLKYRQLGSVEKTLILGPLGTLKGWLDDYKRNSPASVHSTAVIAAGTGKKKMPGKKRAELILDPANKIIITNYESLTMPDVIDALKKVAPKIIVADEIHRLKNPRSKRLKGLLSFSDKSHYRLGLTGTPILKDLMDVWAQMRVVDRGRRFGKNFVTQYRNLYFYDKNAGMAGNSNYFPNWVLKPGVEKEVPAKMRELVSRKTKDECLTLPPRVTVVLDVELSAEQQRCYDEMEEELIASVVQGEATASNALVRILRLRQIMCGFMPVETMDEDPEPTRIVRFKENPRLDTLRDVLEDLPQGKKIIIWSTFTANYPVLRELCEELGLGYAEYTGQTKDKDGEKARFIEDPNCVALLANPQAGGTGVDGLQAVCDYYTYFDRSHNAEHYWQSRDRIHRGGCEVHKKITELHLIAKGTFDEEIYNCLVNKEEFAGKVLERLRSKYAKQEAMEG